MYLTRNPCILASTSFYSSLKSSTVLFKCWDWQLPRSLAALNNPPFKWSSPNPASVESSPGAHRGGLSAFHRAEGEVMSGAPKIPEGRTQQASYTAPIIPVSQGGFTNWGRKNVYLSWLPFAGATRGWGSPNLLQAGGLGLPPPLGGLFTYAKTVVLAFLSKHQNKMFLFKEPMPGWREEVREGLWVATSQEKKEEWRGEMKLWVRVVE